MLTSLSSGGFSFEPPPVGSEKGLGDMVMTASFQRLLGNIEKKTGLSASELRKKSPEEYREYITQRTRKPFQINSEYPIIGRGGVLRDGLASSREINADIDKIVERVCE